MHAFIMANMDAFECIATKLDVREFSSQNISAEIKSKILELHWTAVGSTLSIGDLLL